METIDNINKQILCLGSRLTMNAARKHMGNRLTMNAAIIVARKNIRVK